MPLAGRQDSHHPVPTSQSDVWLKPGALILNPSPKPYACGEAEGEGGGELFALGGFGRRVRQMARKALVWVV